MFITTKPTSLFFNTFKLPNTYLMYNLLYNNKNDYFRNKNVRINLEQAFPNDDDPRDKFINLLYKIYITVRNFNIYIFSYICKCKLRVYNLLYLDL